MASPTAPLTWSATGESERAEVPGGRLILRFELGCARLSYQADRPASMSAEKAAQAKAASRPANRRYWEIAALAPGEGQAGSFADIAAAKAALDGLISAGQPTIGSRLLATEGFRIAGTDIYGGITWLRQHRNRREVVVTNDHRVYAQIEGFGLKTPKVVMDIPLDNRVVERGLFQKPVSVHYVWPSFMADTDCLTRLAVAALEASA